MNNPKLLFVLPAEALSRTRLPSVLAHYDWTVTVTPADYDIFPT